MLFRRPEWMSGIVGQPQSRGFLWGVGTAVAAYFVWPAVKEVFRPASRGMVRGALVAGDRFRYALANAREGLEDIVAEAQFDRMRDTVDPSTTTGTDLDHPKEQH